jgi:hypothetical protein
VEDYEPVMSVDEDAASRYGDRLLGDESVAVAFPALMCAAPRSVRLRRAEAPVRSGCGAPSTVRRAVPE